MPRRFYSEQPISSDIVPIEGDEAKHILAVNRLGVGDDVVLFDGSGQEFVGKISETAKRSLKVEIVGAEIVSRETNVDLTLAVALPKGDRQKQLVEKLVEVGVQKLIPLNCSRSVAKVSEKSLEKLSRRVIEASKQCGRNILMQIDSPTSFTDLIESGDVGCQNFVAHPTGAREQGLELENRTAEKYLVAIGPEGGFSEEEIEFATGNAANGWRTVHLGPTIMRVETAAVVAAALFGLR